METVQESRGLSLVLGDVDRDRFFAEHWERRSLHLRHGDPERFAHLISHDRFFDTEIRRCAHLKASARDADGWNHEVRIQPEQALKLFRTGMTICATMLDPAGPAGELISAFRAEITTALPPHVNCYYSPDQRGYGLHFDTHPVWILQVAGSKHWTVSYEPAVRNPLFNVVYPPGRDRIKLPWITLDRPDVDDPDRFMHLCLEPGDVLYLPAGCWHAARAEGSSLALTVALDPITTTDLFSFLLRQVMPPQRSDTAGRISAFPTIDHGGCPGRGGARARIEADLGQLKELVNRLDVDAVMKIYDHFADHPEMFANRQFVDAPGQVKAMTDQYGSTGRHHGR